MEFITHATNFKIVAKQDQTFNYKLRIYGIYLIAGERNLFQPLVEET